MEARKAEKPEYRGLKLVVWAVLILVALGWGVKDYRTSQVFGTDKRYSLIITGESGETTLVSFDPTEKRILSLSYPSELLVKSRSVGEYQLGSLYKLGEYEREGGEFARRKIQGFMRIPMQGYVITQKSKVKSQNSEVKSQSLSRSLLTKSLWGRVGGRNKSNLSRLDALTLLSRINIYTWKEATQDELIRAGVLTQTDGIMRFHPERLQEYVGSRLFDWQVGVAGLTVAVVNNSGIDGLGGDIADFLTNLGFDVVAVRSGTEQKEVSRVVTSDSKKYRREVDYLQNLFGWPEAEEADTQDYRAEIVVYVGVDAVKLF